MHKYGFSSPIKLWLKKNIIIFIIIINIIVIYFLYNYFQFFNIFFENVIDDFCHEYIYFCQPNLFWG